MWVTEILGEYIRGVGPEDIPGAAKEMAKRCILDLLGAAIAGFDMAAPRITKGVAGKLFREGKATVWGSSSCLHPAGAALFNSSAASALDLDDGHRAAGGHPGASIIPAAVAVAEEMESSPEEFMAAVVLGYEIGVRVASARDFTTLDTLSTGRWCSYGAAAAGGYLRRLPAQKLAEALAVAGVLSPNLSASGYSSVMGNNVKEGIPVATFIGLLALDLAEQGFTGPTDILDHPRYYERERITKNLGNEFAIEKVYFKPYSCCRWIHSALDGLVEIVSEQSLSPRDIDKVEVHTFNRALRLNNYTNPGSIESAQYSIPYCLAVAAFSGGKALLPLDSGCLGHPELIRFAEKVELSTDPELDRLFPEKVPARLIVHTAQGCFEKLVENPLGDPLNPLDLPGLEAKFRTLTASYFSGDEQERMIRAIESLEKDGFSEMLSLLRASGSSADRAVK